MRRVACVQFSTNLQSITVFHWWINSLMNSYLNYPPYFRYCSLFHKVVNNTSTPIGIADSHEEVGVPGQKILNARMASTQSILSSTYHKVQLNPCMPSLTSQSCGDFLPTANLGKMGPFIDNLSTLGC